MKDLPLVKDISTQLISLRRWVFHCLSQWHYFFRKPWKNVYSFPPIFSISIFQTICILVERWMMVSLYILIVVLFITNIMFSLFLFRRRSIETKRRELKSMLDDFRRERDEVISIISSRDKER